MGRPIPLLVALLLLPAALAAQADLTALRASLDVEEELLRADLAAYEVAREAEREAAVQVEEAAVELDEALAARATPLPELDRLAVELAAAQKAAAVTGERAAELRQRIFERRRRSQVLRLELRRRAEAAQGGDPVSGRWEVQIASPAASGVFDLRLAGTLVEGSYVMADGRTGSLRGIFVAERLKLERVDAVRGLDGVFEGTVDGERGIVVGFWSPSLLSDGAPGGSGWSGIRVARGSGEEGGEPETEAPAAEEEAGAASEEGEAGTEEGR